MNYQKELSKVVPIFQYRNVLVEKIIGGFMVMGKKVKSMDDVDDVIDESLRTVGILLLSYCVVHPLYVTPLGSHCPL